MLMVFTPMTVFADFTQEDIQAVWNNWPAWVAGDNIVCQDSSAGTPNGSLDGTGNSKELNDRIKFAFQYFILKGLTPKQSAGILGNLRQESGVNPASDNPAAKGGSGGWIPGVDQAGGGIAQWEGGRWSGQTGLLAYVAGKGKFNKPQGDGKNWKVLSIQLDFLWGELTGAGAISKQPGLAEVKASTTVEAATVAFEEKFERARIPNMPRRIILANEVYTMATEKGWANDITSSTDPSETIASTTCPEQEDAATVVGTDGYSFPMAPRKQKDYGTLPCEKPITSGPYTRNGIYTDRYGTKTKNPGCHHDGTPAFDLMDGDGGSKVYAITNGRIVNTTSCYSLNRGSCVPGCSTIQFQAANGTDKKYYWYGHLQNVNVKAGQTVRAGQQIAQVATRKYGGKCWGGGPHLHIDRGCSNGNTPMTGGNKDCRDPSFVPLLKKVWDGLPK